MKYDMEELYLSITKYLYFTMVVTSLMFIIAYISFRSRRKVAESGGISGGLGFPLIGETFSFSASNNEKGCYEFVRLRRLRYGNWFKTRIYGKIHVFVPSREGAKQVLSNEFVDFNKGYVKSMADCVGHKSILCVSQQENHTRIRRLISPPFSLPSLSKFLLYFDRILICNLETLEEKAQPFAVLDLATKMISDAMCNMLMSITEDSLLRMIQKDCTTISDAMVSFPLMIPGTRYYNGIQARKRMIETLRKIIEDRRRGEKNHDDFLEAMLQRDSNPTDEKLDDSEILDNILTLLIAGQTTTAAAMMWAVKFLTDNIQAQETLREEQLPIARNKQQGYLLTLEDLNKMSYGLKVVKETLRMSNVLLWFPRVALKDCTIDGYEIKKGWNVNIDATFIHGDPDIYSNPMQFNPSRFDEMQKPYSFIPFGSGPRTCLGMNMAKVTMLVFLHRLTSAYRWRVHDLDPSLEKKSHIPILKTGYPITLEALSFG